MQRPSPSQDSGPFHPPTEDLCRDTSSDSQISRGLDRFRLRIVLVAPRIAQNVGNIARSATGLGAELHLVGPLGFFLKKKDLKRASVGYFDDLQPISHTGPERFWSDFERSPSTEFYWATKNGSAVYTDLKYAKDAVLIFGNEEEGVPQNFWDFKGLPHIVACRIPTVSVRCLNLATSVGIVGFEVNRQWGLLSGLMK